MATVSAIEYEQCVTNFESRLAKWDAFQEEVERLVPEEELEACIEASATYREGCMKQLVQMSVAWSAAHPVVVPVPPSSNTSSGGACVKLPKVSLPFFSGDPLKFAPFWQQFEACVDDNEDLADVQKFNYLLGQLKGAAAASVEGIPVTSENYSLAKEVVRKRFGREELIKHSHIKALLNIKYPDAQTGIAAFYDKLNAHVRSLDALGIKSEQFGVVLAPIVVDRLPADVQEEWSKISEGRESDLSSLMQFLEAELKRRERKKTMTVNEDKGSCAKDKLSGSKPSGSALVNSGGGRAYPGRRRVDEISAYFVHGPITIVHTAILYLEYH